MKWIELMQRLSLQKNQALNNREANTASRFLLYNVSEENKNHRSVNLQPKNN